MMAHKGRSGGRARYSLRGVRFDSDITLSTLGNVTVLTNGVTGNADGAYRMISIETTWSRKGGTGGEGPITVGYAHSDYSAAEIKEALEVNASISVGSKIENEQANRLVRIVGVFPGLGTDEALDDNRPIKTRLNWFIPIGKEVNLFAYNNSGASLTTGTVIDCVGKCWVKDSQ